MTDIVIPAEMLQPVARIEESFEKLKTFVFHPTLPEPTGNDFDDWFNQIRLDATKSEYAIAVAAAIKDAAKFFKMRPSRLEVTFRSPKEPYAQRREQQKRIIELHRQLYDFLAKHKIDLYHDHVTEHGVSLRPPRPVRKSKSRIRFENAEW